MVEIARFFYKHAQRELFYLSVVYLLLIIPAAYYLPGWLGWENGVLENLQVVLLAVGMIVNFCFYRRHHWLAFLGSALVFGVAVLRELSWGRVFFPTGEVTETGPVFIRMSALPHHELINIAIGLLIIGSFALFMLNFPWRRAFTLVAVPYRHIGLIVMSMLLAHCGEHTALFPEVAGMLVEELSELLLYFWLVNISAYYYFGLAKAEALGYRAWRLTH